MGRFARNVTKETISQKNNSIHNLTNYKLHSSTFNIKHTNNLHNRNANIYRFTHNNKTRRHEKMFAIIGFKGKSTVPCFCRMTRNLKTANTIKDEMLKREDYNIEIQRI